ncbi:hypothetical protein [Streptomyces sp. Tu 3180]|uniref:hypothetical protein n=1 Tax=Streptomyces sp. Tu 3180 TaxID=2682611 RepID=UPI001358A8A6|nr:hypothetical protein [Streptomyces sp. Tu 3180]KAF3470009.1 hypothetical protein GL259_00365 [Streptomyces sp. Tu 3180]
MLVVDFDFFFHNPLEGLPVPHRGDPLLYDWAHTEAVPFLQDGIWTFRAEDFYRAGITPPRCEGLDGFWDRFTITSTRPPLFYADSNRYAGRLTPAHYALFDGTAAAWQEVHLFDAHHDSGYPHQGGPRTFQEWSARGSTPARTGCSSTTRRARGSCSPIPPGTREGTAIRRWSRSRRTSTTRRPSRPPSHRVPVPLRRLGPLLVRRPVHPAP